MIFWNLFYKLVVSNLDKNTAPFKNKTLIGNLINVKALKTDDTI